MPGQPSQTQQLHNRVSRAIIKCRGVSCSRMLDSNLPLSVMLSFALKTPRAHFRLVSAFSPPYR